MKDLTPIDSYNDLTDGFSCSGNLFSRRDQSLVLSIFTRRYTGDHKPGWANLNNHEGVVDWPLQFASDEEWLANTNFALSTNGNLDKRVKRCWEKPTWPNGEMAYGLPMKKLPLFVQARFAPNLQIKGWHIEFNKWLVQYKKNEEERKKQDEIAMTGMNSAQRFEYLREKYKDEV